MERRINLQASLSFVESAKGYEKGRLVVMERTISQMGEYLRKNMLDDCAVISFEGDAIVARWYEYPVDEPEESDNA